MIDTGTAGGDTARQEEGKMVYHIRKPLKPAGGNQYYRDKSNRFAGTYCEAEPTSYDISSRDTAFTWVHTEHGHMNPCGVCILRRRMAIRATA